MLRISILVLVLLKGIVAPPGPVFPEWDPIYKKTPAGTVMNEWMMYLIKIFF